MTDLYLFTNENMVRSRLFYYNKEWFKKEIWNIKFIKIMEEFYGEGLYN